MSVEPGAGDRCEHARDSDGDAHGRGQLAERCAEVVSHDGQKDSDCVNEHPVVDGGRHRHRPDHPPARIVPAPSCCAQPPGSRTSTVPSLILVSNSCCGDVAGPCTTAPSASRNVEPCHGHTMQPCPSSTVKDPSDSGPDK